MSKAAGSEASNDQALASGVSTTGTSATSTSATGTPRPAGAMAQTFAAQRDWPNYFRAVEGKGPRETLVAALDRFDAEDAKDSPASLAWAHQRGLAIDLGCGEGRDTVELLRRGWRVLAIDGHPMGLDLLRARLASPELRTVAPGVAARLECVLAPMEDAPLPTCRAFNASFALPFCAPARFADLWKRVVGSIEPGGRFCGQLFGDRDEWAPLPDRTHHSRAELDRLFAGFLLEELREEEKDSPDAEGRAKHWHVFHIVARKFTGA